MHKNVVAQIRKATRRKYSAEEKIRIFLEGLRGEIPFEYCDGAEGETRTLRGSPPSKMATVMPSHIGNTFQEIAPTSEGVL